jgi:exopolysaccharide biosynthesis WecB/TagA/CpsF family protein
MWVDFDRLVSVNDGGALAFGFPSHGPPKWQQNWRSFVGQLTVTPDHAAKDEMLDQFAYGHGIRTFGFINAHAMNSAVDDPKFAADLLFLDNLVRDGIGVNTLYRMLGSQSGLNLNGTDLLPELIARFAGKRIALFGSQADIAERAADRLRREHGCDVITADGFQSDAFYLNRIAEMRPALVVLGMGMPKQERVARLLKTALHNDVAIVCGGAILDFLSGHKPRAPLLMRRAGLEWAFRLMIEPRRLFHRYIVGNPLFLLRSARFALRPLAAARKERSLPERVATTEPFGIGGPIVTPQTQPMYPAATKALHRLPDIQVPIGALVPVAQPVPAAAEAIRRSAVSKFSANRPVIARDDLFGRQHDLDRLLNWVLDQSGSALIYGPRGYGKTSLVRVFGEIADSRRHVVLYASCSRDIGFDELMRAYLGELPKAGTHEDIGTTPLSVQQVAARFEAITDASVVVIIDEFDRIERADTRQSIIELVKDVSDLTASVRFVIVGVATDASAILGYHPSVHRCITCVPLARLDAAAITDMLTRKSLADGLVIDAGEIDTIVRLTAGSAYHAQLAGQKIVANARRANTRIVSADDVDSVIVEIISDAMLMDDSFARLLGSLHDGRRSAQLSALAHMALSGADDIVRLQPETMIDASQAGTADALSSLCAELLAGGILRPVDQQRSETDLRFANAFLPQLLLMVEHAASRPVPRAA